jgi:hypothetical protein
MKSSSLGDWRSADAIPCSRSLNYSHGLGLIVCDKERTNVVIRLG